MTACAAPPKESWTDRTRDIGAEWNRDRLEEHLGRLRARGMHLPLQEGGGGFQAAGKPRTHYDRYLLDEAFDLYVLWTDERRESVRSTEVLGLPDFRARIDPDLFDAVLLLHRCPDPRQLWDFDAVRLIRTVNALLRLGERARPALQAYVDLCRSTRWEDQLRYGLSEFRILPVLQLLYERPGGMPAFALGDPGLAPPGPDTWPLFPLALEGDNPFIVVSGYDLPESGVSVNSHLQAGGTRRTVPLAPSINPVEAVERLTFSTRWDALLNASTPAHPKHTRESAKRLLWLVRREALHAIDAVYAPAPEGEPDDCCKDPSEVYWRRIVEEVRTLGIHWDATRQDFVRSR